VTHLEFNTSLLRERFILREQDKTSLGKPKALHAVSNRIDIELLGDHAERFVVRAQNMHICVRVMARIVQSFLRMGAITNRDTDHDWAQDWEAVFNDYERFHNPDLWCSIYHDGKDVFNYGEHHPFLDLIEKYAAGHDGIYDDSVLLAEKALKKSGQHLEIEHIRSVALSLELMPAHCRCGIIHRAPQQTTTFSFHAYPLEGEKQVNIPQIVSACAAYLEGIQLAYMIGMNGVKQALGIIEAYSEAERHTQRARDRLGRLRSEIQDMERAHIVRYRPDKPDFTLLIHEAEELAEQTFEAPEGKEPAEDWLIPEKHPEKPRKQDTPNDDPPGPDAPLRGDSGKLFS